MSELPIISVLFCKVFCFVRGGRYAVISVLCIPTVTPKSWIVCIYRCTAFSDYCPYFVSLSDDKCVVCKAYAVVTGGRSSMAEFVESNVLYKRYTTVYVM